MAKVLIHLGLPKTATTTLQGYIFHPLSRKKKINYLGRYHNTEMEGHYFTLRDVFSSILYDTDERFKSKLITNKQHINSSLDEKSLNVISEEMLTVSYKTDEHDLNIVRNITRIKELFTEHNVRFLLSIRNQVNLIYSFFVEFYPNAFIADNENNTLTKYINNNIVSVSDGNFSMYNYCLITEILEQKFSKDNVDIIVYEDLVSNRGRYIQTLSHALGVESTEIDQLLSDKRANEKEKNIKGYSSASIGLGKRITKILKKVTPSFLYNFTGIMRIYRFVVSKLDTIQTSSEVVEYLKPDQQQVIMNRFSTINKKLDAKYDLGLHLHNYYNYNKDSQ